MIDSDRLFKGFTLLGLVILAVFTILKLEYDFSSENSLKNFYEDKISIQFHRDLLMENTNQFDKYSNTLQTDPERTIHKNIVNYTIHSTMPEGQKLVYLDGDSEIKMLTQDSIKPIVLTNTGGNVRNNFVISEDKSKVLYTTIHSNLVDGIDTNVQSIIDSRYIHMPIDKIYLLDLTTYQNTLLLDIDKIDFVLPDILAENFNINDPWGGLTHLYGKYTWLLDFRDNKGSFYYKSGTGIFLYDITRNTHSKIYDLNISDYCSFSSSGKYVHQILLVNSGCYEGGGWRIFHDNGETLMPVNNAFGFAYTRGTYPELFLPNHVILDTWEPQGNTVIHKRSIRDKMSFSELYDSIQSDYSYTTDLGIFDDEFTYYFRVIQDLYEVIKISHTTLKEEIVTRFSAKQNYPPSVSYDPYTQSLVYETSSSNYESNTISKKIFLRDVSTDIESVLMGLDINDNTDKNFNFKGFIISEGGNRPEDVSQEDIPINPSEVQEEAAGELQE